MDVKNKVAIVVEQQMQTKVKKVRSIGKGASGKVYKVFIESQPYVIAVKTSNYFDTLNKEKEMLDFLCEKVDYNVPKTLFIQKNDDISFLGMHFIKGVSGKSPLINFAPNKNHLSHSIVDAFLSHQAVKNDKFGVYNNPMYDNWYDYYKQFFATIYSFSTEKYNKGQLSKTVLDALDLVKMNFDMLFGNIICQACLCHGDFWMPNLIVDLAKSELAGVVDPFNMLWAEPEYELFTLTVGYGEKLKLYDVYKSKTQVSGYCDIKVEIYALCNELDWYSVLGEIDHNYLEFRAKRVIEQFDRIK